jgi:hypothetical protein
MTKSIATVFVTIMLMAQIGVAQHNTVHFSDHGHYQQAHLEHDNGHDEYDDHHNDDQKKSASDACQICLLAKSLSFACVSADGYVLPPVMAGHRTYKRHDQITLITKVARYNPRAPPSLLI